jgi:hypothetical protein
MAFAQHDLAPKSWELGKYVLILATLGIFAKVLRIDVSGLEILGVKLGTESDALIPGFIGLALLYTFVAFCVARLENIFVLRGDHHTKAVLDEMPKNRSLRWLSYVSLAPSVVVYSMPLLLGTFATWYLRADSLAVVKLVLRDAF